MFPQLTFAQVSQGDMKKDGKLLSFKAVAYRTEMWAGGATLRASRHLSWRFWRLFFLVAQKLRTDRGSSGARF